MERNGRVRHAEARQVSGVGFAAVSYGKQVWMVSRCE